jgi:hypothetical protein
VDVELDAEERAHDGYLKLSTVPVFLFFFLLFRHEPHFRGTDTFDSSIIILGQPTDTRISGLMVGCFAAFGG